MKKNDLGADFLRKLKNRRTVVGVLGLGYVGLPLALRLRARRRMRDARIPVLGIAYKKNVDDLRESPSIELMDQLMRLGAKVDYSDPWPPTPTSSITRSSQNTRN